MPDSSFVTSPDWGQPQSPVPGKKPVPRGPLILAMGGLAGVLLLIGILVLSQDPAPKPTPAAATAPSPTAPEPPASPFTAPGESSGDDLVGQRLAVWYSSGAKSLMQAISNDDTAMTADSSAANSVALSADCEKLEIDAAAALNYGPMPDLQGETHWRAALNDYEAAATDCIAGTSNSDASEITKFVATLKQASDEEVLAATRIGEINSGQ